MRPIGPCFIMLFSAGLAGCIDVQATNGRVMTSGTLSAKVLAATEESARSDLPCAAGPVAVRVLFARATANTLEGEFYGEGCGRRVTYGVVQGHEPYQLVLLSSVDVAPRTSPAAASATRSEATN